VWVDWGNGVPHLLTSRKDSSYIRSLGITKSLNMPASNKMLKRRELAKNVSAGIGDEHGRMSHKEVRVAVMAKCTMCGLEVRTTKTNTELKAHSEAKHSTFTFAECFPGQFDPTIAPVVVEKEKPKAEVVPVEGATEGAEGPMGGVEGMGVFTGVEGKKPEEKKKKAKKVVDLSFLDASVSAPKKK
jgi:hypothetical protein